MKIPTELYDPNVYSNYAYKQEPVVVVNNDKKDKKEAKKRTVKKLKTAIPKKLRKSKYEQTEEQKLRIYKNYIQPQLVDNDTNDPNNDLVQSLKDVFGKDNKEELNKPLPSFTYENEAVRQKLADELFSVENENKRNDAALTIQKGLKAPLQKRKQRKELFDLVSNTSYKNLDEKPPITYNYNENLSNEKNNLLSNSLEGIVGTAKKDKKDKTDKENQSAKIITRALTKAKNAKDNKRIQEGLKVAKILNQYDKGESGMYVGSVKRGNRVVGLETYNSPQKAENIQQKSKTPEKPKNLLSNFNDAERPKRVYRAIKSNGISKKDASTQPRGAGRPKLSSYRIAKASNFKSSKNQSYDIL
jgi:hypothetical protein